MAGPGDRDIRNSRSTEWADDFCTIRMVALA